MSSASFYTAMKPDAVKTVEEEARLVQEVFESFVGDTTDSREKLVDAIRNVGGFDQIRVVTVTVTIDDELTDTRVVN